MSARRAARRSRRARRSGRARRLSAARLATGRAPRALQLGRRGARRQQRRAVDRRRRTSTQVSLLPPPRCIETTCASPAAGDAREAARHHARSRRVRRPPRSTRSTSCARHERGSSSHAGIVRERQPLLRDVARAAAPRSRADASSRAPAASSRRRTPARCAVPREGRLDRPGRRVAARTAARGSSPHHQVAHRRQRSSSPSRRAQSAGRNAVQRRRSRASPLPSALATTTLPARTACTRPGTPSAESGRSSSGSQNSSSRRRRMHVHRLQALPASSGRARSSRTVRSPPSTSVIAEVAREVGVLEVGLVVRPGREQHDARRLRRPAARARAACRAACWKKPREPLHVQRRGRPRGTARDSQAVLERVARARRRLRALGEHPPAAVGRAREIEGGDVQVHAAGRRRRRGRRAGSRDGRTPARAAAGLRAAGAAGRRGRPARRRAARARCARPPRSAVHSAGGSDERQQVELPRAASAPVGSP